VRQKHETEIVIVFSSLWGV